MTTNFNCRYGVYHPEHLIDLLRAGARFPVWQTFSIPSSSNKNDIEDFIERKFPPISEERYEVWLRFHFNENLCKTSLSIVEIESAHFYSKHRQDATSAGVLHTLGVYGIQVGAPLDEIIQPVLEEYSNKVREHVATTIVKAWFPKVAISDSFVEQLKIGYKYQQSFAPEKLPAIPSSMIWAHLVAYNPGLRKFQERPRVLLLQDIQEVLRRTDPDFKNDLKAIGDKYSSKFSDLVDQADIFKGELSKWLLQNHRIPGTYLYDVEQYLNKSASQQSFFYTSLLYLYWRTEILNKDYSGKLADKENILLFLRNASSTGMEQAVAEALFTIIYAGGARVFQKALIEARFKLLNIPKIDTNKVIETLTVVNPPTVPKSPILRIFSLVKRELGKIFDDKYKQIATEKKTQVLKEIKSICGKKEKMSKGELDYAEYQKLCSLFEIPVEKFADEPAANRVNEDETIKPSAIGESLNETADHDLLKKDQLEADEQPTQIPLGNDVLVVASETPWDLEDHPTAGSSTDINTSNDIYDRLSSEQIEGDKQLTNESEQVSNQQGTEASMPGFGLSETNIQPGYRGEENELIGKSSIGKEEDTVVEISISEIKDARSISAENMVDGNNKKKKNGKKSLLDLAREQVVEGKKQEENVPK